MSSHRFPAEVTERRDARTGRRVLQLTAHPSIHHHLYFLTSSLTPDERWLIFCSYRGGSPQFYRTGFPAGEIERLTDEPGIHGFSGVISPDGTQLYYTAGSRVRALTLDTASAMTLTDFAGAQLGECSLSAGGRAIVTAARLSEGGFGLAVVTVDGVTAEIVHRVDRTVIHPQFHPRDPELILYAQDPAPRMWMVRRDGTGDTCLYSHDNDEFLVHETFLGEAGEELIVVRWPYALLRFHLARREFREVARFNAWHIASSRDGRRVLCDTAHPDRGLVLVDVATGARETACYPESSCGGSQWKMDRYALAEDFAAARQAAEREQSLSWMEMKTDTVYGPQWTHPHPSFSPSERWIVYTSDCSGYPQVYAAEVGPVQITPPSEP
jgi:oligogalacturonide lyase